MPLAQLCKLQIPQTPVKTTNNLSWVLAAACVLESGLLFCTGLINYCLSAPSAAFTPHQLVRYRSLFPVISLHGEYLQTR